MRSRWLLSSLLALLLAACGDSPTASETDALAGLTVAQERHATVRTLDEAVAVVHWVLVWRFEPDHVYTYETIWPKGPRPRTGFPDAEDRLYSATGSYWVECASGYERVCTLVGERAEGRTWDWIERRMQAVEPEPFATPLVVGARTVSIGNQVYLVVTEEELAAMLAEDGSG